MRLDAPATLGLVLATVATYAVQVLAGGDAVQRGIGLIPARLSDPGVGDGQVLPAWATLFTYVLGHGSWWHVSMNMAGLWWFGRLAEPQMGSRRFLLAYVASGVLTGLVIVLIVPHSKKPAVGASGAICGVLGVFLALSLPRWPARDRRNLGLLAIEVSSLLGVVAWLLMRTPPQVPDRMSALMWHLIPFLGGWMWMRAKGYSYRTPCPAA